jgi:hypothetical protein
VPARATVTLVYSTRAASSAQPQALVQVPAPIQPTPAPPAPEPESTPQEVFSDPIVQLAALCPLCALAALSPEAALAVLSPTLRTFNPALNPGAAHLAFSGFNPTKYQRGRIGR